MKCPQPDCGLENTDDRQYCDDCGKALKATQSEGTEGVVEDSLAEQTSAEQARAVAADGAPAPADVNTKEVAEFGLNLRVASGLDIGGKDEQEDACLAITVLYPARDPEFAVAALIGADGIGGSGDAGEVFAQTAVHILWTGIRRLLPYSERFQRFWATASREQCWDLLNNSLRAQDPSRDPLMAQVFWANSCVQNFAKTLLSPQQLENNGYGCTLVVAVMICDLKKGHIVIHGYNEGDAKIFVRLGNRIEQLSMDHTEQQGERDFLSRWLGRCDTPGGTRFERILQPGDTEGGGSVLICSDGLTNMLAAQDIAAVCQEAESGTECEALIARALTVETPHNPTHEPGDDNIFVAIADFRKGE